MKRSNVNTGEGTPNPAVTATSLSLLARVRAGDQSGWSRLVRLYGPLVYSWCRQSGLSPEDASDVAQDVFSSVWKNFEQFRRVKPSDSFRKWLKTIAFNRARDYHRRRRRQAAARGGTTAQLQLAALPDRGGPAEVPGVEVPATEVPGAIEETPDQRAREEAHLLRQAMELVRDDFEPKSWQAFWQTAIEGRSAPDVAADLGLTANAVRIAKSRIRARLREEMDGLLS